MIGDFFRLWIIWSRAMLSNTVNGVKSGVSVSNQHRSRVASNWFTAADEDLLNGAEQVVCCTEF